MTETILAYSNWSWALTLYSSYCTLSRLTILILNYADSWALGLTCKSSYAGRSIFFFDNQAGLSKQNSSSRTLQAGLSKCENEQKLLASIEPRETTIRSVMCEGSLLWSTIRGRLALARCLKAQGKTSWWLTSHMKIIPVWIQSGAIVVWDCCKSFSKLMHPSFPQHNAS